MGCRIAIFLLALFSISSLKAQVAPQKYWIEFTDKNNSPYSIGTPEEFLTQRAIERRLKQNISIQENDLPVNPHYIDSVASKGAVILNRSRWFNAISIYAPDSAMIVQINALPFVKETVPIFRKPKGSSPDKLEVIATPKSDSDFGPQFSQEAYGEAINQIDLIGGLPLHAQGIRGQGMVIAVLDAGFEKVGTLEVFEKMRNEGRLLGGKDFIELDGVYLDHHSHGTAVLSTMATDLEGEMIGTAPDASYWLLRTEDGGSEAIIEEYNWISGVEFADSVGADIINSSLGYTEFDDTTMSHTYADMDGNTTPITRAADIAASKGILVVNSAGNSGSSQWYHIGAPADGDSVLAVGATDEFGLVVDFSSRGPSYDGRVKPNIVAKGYQTSLVNLGDGTITKGNGTSFSGPVIAGMSACLWQANPDKTNMEIFRAIEMSAARYDEPNEHYGYGMPNFSVANMILHGLQPTNTGESEMITAGPNPFDNQFTAHFYSAQEEWAVLQLCDLNGHLLLSQPCDLLYGGYYATTVTGLENLSQGLYIIAIQTRDKTYYSKLVKR